MAFAAVRNDGDRIVVGFVMGDPAGIGAELMVRMLADAAIADAMKLVLLGSRHILELAAESCSTAIDLPSLSREGLTHEAILATPGHVMVETGTDGDLPNIVYGTPTKAGGAFALGNFRLGIELGRRGVIDALCFSPFNKYAMRLAFPPYQDEIVLLSEVLGSGDSVAEFNVADIWTGRVTSHVPLSEVASLITKEAIVRRLRLTDHMMRAAGIAVPRIAVAGLNPHAGDNGNFGREEIDVIAPAVEEGRRLGIDCHGPYAADTVFIRASRGDFNAVLTMYHDQGQIAMKLLSFDRGVVLFGGFPFPVATPAHGTAYDIAGRGSAHPGAMRATLLLAANMALHARAAREKNASASAERV